MTVTSKSLDEWEYEYDETETEDFYVVLDLTSNTGGSRPPRSVWQEKPTVENATKDDAQQQQTENSAEQTTETLPAANGSASPMNQDSMQILELHSQNPIISYKNHLYTCHWASTLGTDLLFSKGSETDASLSKNTSHQLPSPLLATSSIRLIATEAQLQPRQAAKSSPLQPSQEKISTAERASLLALNHAAHPQVSAPSEPADDSIRIPISAAATKVRKDQAAFLEKVYAIKKRRGETDPVLINPDEQRYGMPRDTAQLRLRTMSGLVDLVSEGEDENGNDDERGDAQRNEDESFVDRLESALVPSDIMAIEWQNGEANRGISEGRGGSRRGRGRPRGSRGRGRGKGLGTADSEGNRPIRGRGRGTLSRRGPGALRAPGGLFRDYRPAEGDGPGAEYRAPQAQLEPVTPQTRYPNSDREPLYGTREAR